MPNQAHNCTVWLIQYSYAVDYYFMIYAAHFFPLILPRKVQYNNDTRGGHYQIYTGQCVHLHSKITQDYPKSIFAKIH